MSQNKKPILVVEDDVSIRAYLAEIFRGEDFEVATAENGADALRVLTSMARMPGVIFLDLMMPVMDGQAFLLELQGNSLYSAYSKIPVVVLSASRFEVYGDVKVYLTKPPQLSYLCELAEKYAGSDEVFTSAGC